MKVIVQIFAVLFACLLLTSAAPSYGLRETSRAVDLVCKRGQNCRWAVCAWSQWFLVSADNCQFVESICRCPVNTQCTRTNAMRPGSEVIVFHYRCHP